MSVYSLQPINKTAAIVTSAPSGQSEREAIESKRENLILRKNQLEEEVRNTRNKYRRKALGVSVFEINEELSKLKEVLVQFDSDDASFESVLLDVIKENIGAYKFKQMIGIARARCKK